MRSSLLEITKKFAYNKTAELWLRQLRCPTGITCPLCASERIAKLRKESKQQSGRIVVISEFEANCI